MATKEDPKGVKTYTTPSAYGSHASMRVDPLIEIVSLGWFKARKIVLAQDERGTYYTFRNRLDSGLADPRRLAAR